MEQPEPTIFVVDDDEAVRNSLQWLLQSVGMRVEIYPNATAFLDNCDPSKFGCLILDVRLPDMSGLELLDHLREKKIGIPVIIITGHGDVPTAVRAMKTGAVDFIEKPFNDQVLLDQIQRAIESDVRAHAERAEGVEALERLKSLTAREHQVLDRILAGKTSKEIARDLSLADRTIEHYRALIMGKMEAENAAHLVRLAMLAKAAL